MLSLTVKLFALALALENISLAYKICLPKWLKTQSSSVSHSLRPKSLITTLAGPSSRQFHRSRRFGHCCHARGDRFQPSCREFPFQPAPFTYTSSLDP